MKRSVWRNEEEDVSVDSRRWFRRRAVMKSVEVVKILYSRKEKSKDGRRGGWQDDRGAYENEGESVYLGDRCAHCHVGVTSGGEDFPT